MSLKLSLSLITAVALTAAAGRVAHAQSIGTTNSPIGLAQPGAFMGPTNSPTGLAQPGASMGTINPPIGTAQPGTSMGITNPQFGPTQPLAPMGPTGGSQIGSAGIGNPNGVQYPSPMPPPQPTTRSPVPGMVP